MVGTDNIRKYYDGEVAHRLQSVTLKQTETRALGPNTILDAGVWAGDLPDAKLGKPLHLSGTLYRIGWCKRTLGACWRPNLEL